jgi:hypothetical protein
LEKTKIALQTCDHCLYFSVVMLSYIDEVF